jgi:hypothetical protein
MRRLYHNNTSFLDLLFNFLLATTILLVIAVLHIVVQNNKADIKTQAEFIITVTWDKTIDFDIDTWVQDPDDLLLWYRQREIGIMHIDRDDRGHISTGEPDYYLNSSGELVYNPNQEIITIRGIKPGEWIINLHLFRVGDFDKLPITVNISFIKLNPKAITIIQREIIFTEYWQQETIARVIISETGEILNIEDGPFKDLVEEKVSPSVAVQNPQHRRPEE